MLGGYVPSPPKMPPSLLGGYSLKKALEAFEQEHPETSIKDLINPNYPLPENTLLAKVLTPVKKNLLISIVRTSGYLHTHKDRGYVDCLPFHCSLEST
jgi:hypothetical protein